VVSVTVGNIEPAVGQIAKARRKPEPQQVAEPEYVLGRAAGIGIVLSDDEGAFMVEEAIQNVGRLACVSRNDLGVERRKPVGVSALVAIPSRAEPWDKMSDPFSTGTAIAGRTSLQGFGIAP
jgi:hypothetical protein